MNMPSRMSPVPEKTSDTVNFYSKLLHCDETACCIWYTVAESQTVLWVTHLSAAHPFLQLPALWHKYIHPDKY